jgi:hemolysin activation/secretion protein
MSCRSLVADAEEFSNKRYKAKPNYLYATAGVQRNQKLPWGMGLFIKIDGQAADQPLVSNEQYAAGGMESVRGYKEAEAMRQRLRLTTELFFSNSLEKWISSSGCRFPPFVFN